MFSISNSLAFLLSARKSLSESVETTDLKKKEKVILQSFFMNEATDYEIMYILLKDKFPKTRYDEVKEQKLFDELKASLVEHFSTISKVIDKSSIESIILEVGPISGSGLSSAIPIIEFLLNNGHVTLREAEEDIKPVPAFPSGSPRVPGGSGWGSKAAGTAKKFFTKPGGKIRKGRVAAAAMAAGAVAGYAAHRAAKARAERAKYCAKVPPEQRAECLKSYK